ncbi:unnamed protein product [Prorocentrum cordatum]|uniref:Uncharacterized protein n=1 Tax=Prorocentrum cordatum TaxID=2364126 RepID=A0ABN9PTF5_9DINO|nr:unnamed protein product [Polarella glacialis]
MAEFSAARWPRSQSPWSPLRRATGPGRSRGRAPVRARRLRAASGGERGVLFAALACDGGDGCDEDEPEGNAPVKAEAVVAAPRGNGPAERHGGDDDELQAEAMARAAADRQRMVAEQSEEKQGSEGAVELVQGGAMLLPKAPEGATREDFVEAKSEGGMGEPVVDGEKAVDAPAVAEREGEVDESVVVEGHLGNDGGGIGTQAEGAAVPSLPKAPPGCAGGAGEYVVVVETKRTDKDGAPRRGRTRAQRRAAQAVGTAEPYEGVRAGAPRPRL